MNPYDSPTQESRTSPARVRASTWFPILAGVLSGCAGWWGLQMLDSGSSNPVTVWIHARRWNDVLCVLFAMAIAGGCIGAAFSTWPYSKRFLFLLGTVVVLQALVALGHK